jgi:cobalt-zinc-cadmium resistance protein CzcA
LATTIEDLRAIVLADVDGTLIRLADVANVEVGHEIRRGAVTHAGEGEAVLGLGFMLMGENSREITRALSARLQEVQKSLPEDVTVTPVYSRAQLVDQVLETVRDNLLEGALLVIAVLFLLLGNLRAGVIVALAIPLSMLFAFNAMLRFGVAGSLMSLGALDFGLVVDSSVIMVENASRRLAEDRSERSVLEIVRDAAIEVRKPTLFGELIIAVVYLPILALEGVEGKMFRPMALTVIFALVGSMILSMTLMPVLASYVLKKGGTHDEKNWLVRKLEQGYSFCLSGALGAPRIVLGVALLVVLNVGALAMTLGSEFVPRLKEQALVINTVRIAGISLEESVRYGTQIERRLLAAFPDEIDHIWTRTGTAEVATDPMGLEVSDVFITLTPRSSWTRGRTQDELSEAMRAELESMPGMRAIYTQPIEMRVNEMLAGIRTDVGVKVFGDDFDRLSEGAEQVRAAIEEIDGATDVTVEQLTGQAVLSIQVDRQAAGRYGVPVKEVLEVIESLGTRRVGQVVQGQRRFDLVMQLDEDSRSSKEQIGKLLIRTSDGARIPLSAVAKISVTEGPSAIQREWAKRRVTIQANVTGRDIGSFVEELREVLADKSKVNLPQGYYTRVGGEFENLERARARLMIVVPIALLLVFSLLYLTYGSVWDTLRVFTGVPFGAVGGILALWARGMPLSVSAAVGFIALSGVAVLGDIVLVSRIKDFEEQGASTLDAVTEAARTRMRPVLMTALVAALGFLPMALNTGVGAEVQRPLATVVVGGMLTSTVATLFVLPVLYTAFASRRSGETPPGDEEEALA